jgi:hypothetical protein
MLNPFILLQLSWDFHGIFMVKIQIFAGQVPCFFPAKLWQSGRQVVGEC